jgi:hypothetical protein
MRNLIFALFASLIAFSAHADPLKFKSWKEQQIMEAQNEVLRLSARLHQAKTAAKAEKSSVADDYVTAARFDQGAELTEKDLKRAQDNLLFAKDLTIEDYADVYVSDLQQKPEQFSKLVDSLSKEELSQIMRILMKNKAEETSDAKHNKASLPPNFALSSHHS